MAPGDAADRRPSEDVLLDMGEQRELMQAAAESPTVDESLDLPQLAQRRQSVTSGSVDFRTVPNLGTGRDEQDRSIIRLEDERSLRAFSADLSAEPAEPAAPQPRAPAVAAPADVSVQVCNGSGTAGPASSAGAALARAGFEVTETANADSTGYPVTEIRHAPGAGPPVAAPAAVVPGAVVQEVADAATGTGTVGPGLGLQGDRAAADRAAAGPAHRAHGPADGGGHVCVN